VSMPLHFLSTFKLQATVAVYTSGSIGSSDGDSVSFPGCEVNVSDPVLEAPSGYNVCLRVGGLNVKIDFVPKFDVIGLVGVSFLVG
jgi:hypothetical protein